MSQFGMQVPGGRLHRGSGPDIYTALAALAVAFLLAACVVMWFAGAKVGKDGSPFGIQPDPSKGTEKVNIKSVADK